MVHCPELKVMFWEPLILTLRAFVSQSAHRFMNDDDCATLSVLSLGCITYIHIHIHVLSVQVFGSFGSNEPKAEGAVMK